MVFIFGEEGEDADESFYEYEFPFVLRQVTPLFLWIL